MSARALELAAIVVIKIAIAKRNFLRAFITGLFSDWHNSMHGTVTIILSLNAHDEYVEAGLTLVGV